MEPDAEGALVACRRAWSGLDRGWQASLLGGLVVLLAGVL